MEFRTIVDIPASAAKIAPHDSVLLVGSCFADGIGRRFREEQFPAVVNPYGTMYNPASVLHTITAAQRAMHHTLLPKWTFITLGTNHVYVEKATGQIVDNCRKRPQALFEERELSVTECADYLRQAVQVLHRWNPDVYVVFTVSPIRYRKYGYHESQLSKATLLLAVEQVLNEESRMKNENFSSSLYFPAYEMMNDELRDYRFYAPDMLHPSEQAVDYIWERMVETYFSAEARQWLRDWQPVKQALAHKPFHADSAEYQAFMDKTMLKVSELRQKYPTFAPLEK